MTVRRPWRRALKRIAAGVAAVGVLLIALAALAPSIIRGPRFGVVVGWALPPTRGAITVGGGRWSWGDVWALLRGRPAALSLDDVRVVDPEGREVLRAAHITAGVELSRDRTRLVLHDLRVSNGAWRFAAMRDPREVGFLSAFQSARRATPGRPRRGGGLAWFAIAGADLDDLDITFDLPAWGLSVAHVHARGHLAVGAGAVGAAGAAGAAPRPTFTFDVSDADLRGGGVLRVLSGRARVELPFSAGLITRVGTPSDAPDALQIDARDVATGRSRLALAGAFTGIFGASRPRRPGAIDLHARLTDAADAARAVLARHAPPLPVPLSIAGDGARFDLGFAGPFDRVTVTAAARGFDLRVRDLDFRDLGFDLALEPAAGRARVTGLTFTSPAGGRLTLDAGFDQLIVRGALALDHFATAPYLPAFLRPLGGGVLDGGLRGQLDLYGRSAAVDQLALTFTRPPGGAGPRRFRFTSATAPDARAGAAGAETLRIAGARFAQGTLILPVVGGGFAGGQITARARILLTDGAGRLQPPLFDVDARARRISFTRLAGASFATGVLSFGVRARGTLDALEVALDVPAGQTLRVFGEPCRLPASTVLHLDDGGLMIPDFRLHGNDGAELAVAGRIRRSGQLAIALDVRDFPLGKLPALAESGLPVSGQVSGGLRASGAVRAPRLEGEMAIDRATFQGRPIGAGRLTITPRPEGGIHGAGQVIAGVSLDGTMTPREGSVRGDATLRLQEARLDPFLSSLPGGLRGAGSVSGTLEAHIAPGEAPTVEGRLSALALEVTGPLPFARARPRGGTPPPLHTLALHAVGEVRMSARAGGPVRLEPARFAGSAGSLELWGEAENGRAHAGMRGRLALDAAAPLLQPWLSRLAGALDFDLSAATESAGARTVMTGTLRVASPVTLRPAGLPFDAHLATGQIELGAGGVVHLDLPVTLAGGTLRLAGTMTAPALTGATTGDEPRLALDLAGELDAGLLALAAPRIVASAQGRARLDAHVGGQATRPSLRARVRPGDITLALRALPGAALALTGGQLDLDDHAVTANALRLTYRFGAGASARAGDAGAVVTIGAPADGAATLAFGSLFDPRPARVVLPVRGQITALPVAPVVIDDASFALRLDGDLSRVGRLAGEITVARAHVPRARAKAPPAKGAASPSPSPAALMARPELARIDLDVAARSQGGAVTVEVPHLPDVHVDVDYHVGGTVAKPKVTGHFQGADVWSSFALLLRRIFQ